MTSASYFNLIKNSPVYYDTQASTWIARIWVDCKHKYIGCFSSQAVALKHYKRVLEKYYGESNEQGWSS